MDFITIEDAAEMCGVWFIPLSAEKPKDLRKNNRRQPKKAREIIDSISLGESGSQNKKWNSNRMFYWRSNPCH